MEDERVAVQKFLAKLEKRGNDARSADDARTNEAELRKVLNRVRKDLKAVSSVNQVKRLVDQVKRLARFYPTLDRLREKRLIDMAQSEQSTA